MLMKICWGGSSGYHGAKAGLDRLFKYQGRVLLRPEGALFNEVMRSGANKHARSDGPVCTRAESVDPGRARPSRSGSMSPTFSWKS